MSASNLQGSADNYYINHVIVGLSQDYMLSVPFFREEESERYPSWSGRFIVRRRGLGWHDRLLPFIPAVSSSDGWADTLKWCKLAVWSQGITVHSHTGNYLCMGLQGGGGPESVKGVISWVPPSREHDAVQRGCVSTLLTWHFIIVFKEFSECNSLLYPFRVLFNIPDLVRIWPDLRDLVLWTEVVFVPF